MRKDDGWSEYATSSFCDGIKVGKGGCAGRGWLERRRNARYEDTK
jgi:hypothetical protein